GPGTGSERSRCITEPGVQEPTCQKRNLSCSLVTSHCPSGLNATRQDVDGLSVGGNCQTRSFVVKSQTLAPSLPSQSPTAAQRAVGLSATSHSCGVPSRTTCLPGFLASKTMVLLLS